jgi:hypothetical protein
MAWTTREIGLQRTRKTPFKKGYNTAIDELMTLEANETSFVSNLHTVGVAGSKPAPRTIFSPL